MTYGVFPSSAGGGGGWNGPGFPSLAITQANVPLTVGQAVYFDALQGWIPATANAPGTLGIAIVVAQTGPTQFTIVFSGDVTGLPNQMPIEQGGILAPAPLTPGQYYFVSAVIAGALTLTEPGTYSNPILFAVSQTEAIVLPYRPSVTNGGASGPYPLIVAPPPVAALEWVNQGTATAADDVTTGFDIAATGQAGNSRHLLVETIANPVAGWTFDMGLIFTPSRQPIPLAGVAVYSTATTKLVELDLYFDGNSILCQFNRLDSPTAIAGSAYQAPFSAVSGLLLGPFFLRLQSDGTSLSPSYSSDGVNWQSAGSSQPLAAYFGADLPNRVGACVDGPTNAGATPKAHVFHWNKA